jgi:hypothetical protein
VGCGLKGPSDGVLAPSMFRHDAVRDFPRATTGRYARPKYAKLKRSSTVTAPTSSIASIAP